MSEIGKLLPAQQDGWVVISGQNDIPTNPTHLPNV